MEPQRTCIGCRRRDDQSALVRIVRVGEELVDATRPRLEGRGAYLHRGCLPVALKRQAFRRCFGGGVRLSTALEQMLQQAPPVGL
ncbi:YlxR family protein [Arachnia propionica]|uniref:YlxR family protein n=1 Tax=Arachnia propionica TaxID=1750 RepID=A0A3P1T1T2_9ACTN|nr:YlxR family protein [Arachnia propionica]MDO5084068.1 YlxR family protein [Arachnia propionica]RRD03422.1 YlxR family protein [Arachnia propionica]